MSNDIILLPVIEELHENFREAHRKRDQILAFYTALLTGYFVGYSELGDLQLPLAAALALLSVGVGRLLLQYRRWHIRLSYSISLFHHYLALDKMPCLEECKSDWIRVNDKRSCRSLANPFNGIENATFYLFLLVATVPFYIVLFKSQIAFPPLLGGHAAAFALDFLIVSLACWSISLVILRARQAFPESDWMFRWLRPPAEKVSALAPQPDQGEAGSSPAVVAVQGGQSTGVGD